MSLMIDDLRADGFSGFIPLKSFLKDAVIGDRPDVEGVYAIVRESAARPAFREDVHRNPRPKIYSAAEAEARWVDGAQTLYLGKGPLRKLSKGRRQGLAQRLHELRAHGYDGSANHYGGKLLWQIDDMDSLIVAWKVLPAGAADANETALIHRFMKMDSLRRAPYANISKKRSRCI